MAAIGSDCRRDDGVGPAVLARLPQRLEEADVVGPLASPLELLGLWDGADAAIVVDAVRGGSEPGQVYAVDLDVEGSSEAEVTPARRSTSHGLGLVEILRLARTLGSAPAHVVLVGVAGEDFSAGFGLSPATSRGVAPAAKLVVDLVAHPPRSGPSGKRWLDQGCPAEV